MAAKNIDTEMRIYFAQLNKEEQKAVVNLIKTFVKSKNATQERISIEQYNRELDEAEKRIAEGHFITHEQLKEEMKTW